MVPFYQEVLDALAKNSDPALVLVRDLGVAIDADDKATGGPLVERLVGLSSRDVPLSGISTDFYFELLTRVLLLGWFRELRLLMDWFRPVGPLLSGDQALIANWAGVMSAIREPAPGIPLEDLALAFMRHLNALKCAFAELAKIDAPKATNAATLTPGALVSQQPPPAAPPAAPAPPTLESQLLLVVEQVVRVLHMLFQQLLEVALRQLEFDRTSNILRRAQRLHERWGDLLAEEQKRVPDKMLRSLQLRLRIMEIRYRRQPREHHRFVDSFRPKTVRSVEFEPFNRDEVAKPEDTRLFVSDSFRMRGRQLAFWAAAYGVPYQTGAKPSEDDERRQRLIEQEHGNQLKLKTDDDLIRFLTSFFKSVVRIRTAEPINDSVEGARGVAWLAVLDFLHGHLDRLTAHTRFNIWDRDPSYLTFDFPRAVFGGLVHDCGVYAVRVAYILLSLAQAIDRTDKHTFDMRVSWILLPLHIGLLVQTNPGLLIVHNNGLFTFPGERLDKAFEEWKRAAADVGDKDEGDEEAKRQKFLEDVAATMFNPDVDVPMLRFDVIGPGAPATKKSIWASYRRRMREERLFSPLVGVRRARKQYQFDLNYIVASRVHRDWYNIAVVPFWNDKCPTIWNEMLPKLQENFDANKDAYAGRLKDAVYSEAQEPYDSIVLPFKEQLSAALRSDRSLLKKGVRITFSKRLEELKDMGGPIGRVLDHIELVKKTTGLKKGEVIVPPFANPNERLMRLPD